MKIGPDLPCGRQQHCIPAVQKVPNTPHGCYSVLNRPGHYLMNQESGDSIKLIPAEISGTGGIARKASAVENPPPDGGHTRQAG